MLLFLALAGCQSLLQECTLMYAPSSLTLELDVVEEGLWEWTVDVGDRSIACSVTLPDGTDIACTGDVSTAGAPAPSATVGDDGWVLLSGLEPTEAADVHVVVDHDGVNVSDTTESPAWAVDEPNGEGCGERVSAVVAVAI